MSRQFLETKMRARLRALRDDLGVRDVCYCYDVTTPEQWRSRLKTHDRFLKSFVKRRQLFASSESAVTLWRRKTALFANEGSQFSQLFSQECYVWPEALFSPRLKRQLSGLGVASMVTVSVPCVLTSRFCGRFTLMLQGPVQVAYLQTHYEQVKRQLQSEQLAIAADHGIDINPLLDYNIVNPVSACVLDSLAQGEDRGQVSRQLNLTLRGVDYHIGILKEVFQARTIAQLMAQAVRHRLVI
ncbi:hypothetical protein [Ferrimonas sp. SCSIO 43195]|uniref:hypothetical protein n=1 Tax=Ferrimonas sp. SCSIO 43195 TaxID=2822844 RepID=UPI002075B523|nr:hypothetical protein [Ferrimonas sp. SCSIO 43195]USD35911.1 hypothetical protein J8Z22_12740 [Ferrimonas sp. SCSIO 43195]